MALNADASPCMALNADASPCNVRGRPTDEEYLLAVDKYVNMQGTRLAHLAASHCFHLLLES